MSELTARVIGADGRMGKEHVAAFRECGVKVVEGDADIVSIASPDNTHAEYVINALGRGSHVFCEKPLATNTSDLLRMTEMAQRQRLALWQHFPLRYQPLFQSIKSGVDRGKYGDIYRIEASYNWGRTDKLFYGWRAEDPEYSLVLGGMIHMIDLVNWLLGGEEIIPMGVAGVTSLPMRPDVADTVSTLCVNDDGGMTISLTVDGGRGVKDHNHRLLVHGSKGGRSVVNHEPTNKRAMIHDFVKQVESGKQSMEGLSAMATALQIDHALTNAMDEEVLIEI